MQEVIPNNIDGITVEEAKVFYSKLPGIIVNGYLGAPDWNKVLSVKISDKESAMKVALDNPKLDHTTFRDLIFTKDKSGMTRCRVFEVWVHPGYLVQKQNQKGLGFNVRNYIEDADFTGLLILSELSGSIIKGRKYEDGILKSELTFEELSAPELGGLTGDLRKSLNNREKIPSNFNGPEISSGLKEGNPIGAMCKNDGDCIGSGVCVQGVCRWIINIPGVQVKAIGSQPTIPAPSIFDWTFPITISRPSNLGISPANGNGEYGSSSSTSGLGIDWSDPGSPSALFIQDSSASPCIKQALKLAMDRGLTNEITKTFLDLFSANGNKSTPPYFNAIIKEEKLEAGVDAKTKVYISDIYRPIEIVLNNSTLAGASKEFIVAAFLHESIHAMYDAIILKNQSDKILFSGYIQHNLMADKYVVKMATALREMFPSLGDFDAKALAWRGLQDGVSWKALDATTVQKLLLAAQEFDQFHNKGMRCPND